MSLALQFPSLVERGGMAEQLPFLTGFYAFVNGEPLFR